MIWTHQPSPGLPSMHGTFTDGLSLSFYFSVVDISLLGVAVVFGVVTIVVAVVCSP